MRQITKIKEIIDRGPIYKASYYIMTLKAACPLPMDLNGDLNAENAKNYYSARRDTENCR